MLTRRHIELAFRAACSAALIYLVARNVDLVQVKLNLLKADWETLFIGVALNGLIALPHAYRWRLCLRGVQRNISLAEAARETSIGYFFNQVLPTSNGGDAVRVARLWRTGLPFNDAFACALADRIFGLFAAAALSGLALPLIYARSGASPLFTATVLAFFACLCGYALLQLFGLPLRRSRVPAAILRLVVIFRLMSNNRKVFLTLMAYSVAMHLLATASAVALMRSLEIGTSIGTVLILQPVWLLSMIPVSFAGWGLREGLSIVALGIIGIQDVDALSFSFLFGLAVLGASLPGALLFLKARDGVAHKR